MDISLGAASLVQVLDMKMSDILNQSFWGRTVCPPAHGGGRAEVDLELFHRK